MRVILLVLVLLLTACVPSGGAEVGHVNYLRRIVDTEAGVVCFVYAIEGGVSCLPLEETRLRRE